MPLPKIETPRHTLTLPVSGEQVTYRPFLVKEQKVLLQAMEMGDETQMNNAIVDISNACLFGDIDVRNLAMGDVEYLVLAIRAKSVGETTEVMYTCPHCKTKQPVVVNLMDAEVINNEKEDRIMIQDELGVTMKAISFGDVAEAAKEASDVLKAYALMIRSIDTVFDAQQVYSRSDFSDQELVDFLESLPTAEFAKIENYVADQPTIQQTISVNCMKCGEHSEWKAKGLSNFFV